MMLKLELLGDDGLTGDHVYVSVLAIQSVEEKTHRTQRGLGMAAATVRMFGGKEFTVLDMRREVGSTIRDAEERERMLKRRAVFEGARGATE